MVSKWIFVAAIGSLAFLAIIRSKMNRKKNKKNKWKYTTPKRLDDYPMLTPGKGAPVFHGVRVVELATMIAAPSATRLMADLGAEVVKIEEPKGDYWRKFFLDFEPERDFGSGFEVGNLGKRSVVLDLRKPREKEELLKLLGEADVFVTNVRLDGMVRMGLDFETLHKQFPSLVYANVSAWGATGPDKNLPGYDIGPFWAMSGMGVSIHQEGNYQVFPVGLGDVSIGANMLAGIGIALTHRMQTGQGLFVDAALLRVGYWCMAPHILHPAEDDEKPVDTRLFSKEPLWNSYCTKDGCHVMLLHRDSDPSISDKASQLIGSSASSMDRKSQIEAIKKVCAETDYDVLKGRLTKAGIQHSTVNTLLEAINSTDKRFETAGCYADVAEIRDLRRMPRCPIEFSCSSDHYPRGRAPLLGEHSAAFLIRGFSKVSPEADLKKTSKNINSPTRQSGLLHYLRVAELSYDDDNVCVAATCAQLADYGAKIVKVEPATGDPLRKSHWSFFNHLNRCKHSVTVDLETDDGKEKVRALLQKMDVVVTSMAPSRLKRLGLDYESLRIKNPRLIYACITPWGLSGPEDNSGELGAYWGASGLGSEVTGLSQTMAPLPNRLGELMASIYLACGIGVALFHLQRTGEGQRVDINFLRVAIWGNSQMTCIMQKDPSKAKIFYETPEVRRARWPVPTALCFRTKDGVWFQMLGVELPRHLHKTLKAFNIARKAYAKMLLALVFKMPFIKGKKFDKLVCLFMVLNEALTKAVGQLTWAECQALFQEKDIWYCLIQRPSQAATSLQAQCTGVFVDTKGGPVIAAPLYFTSTTDVPLQPMTPLTGPELPHPYPAAPKPGEDNDLILSPLQI